MINHPPQVRVMSNGSGWYWEVVTYDRDVIARGLADSHAQAGTEAEQTMRAIFCSLRASGGPSVQTGQ